VEPQAGPHNPVVAVAPGAVRRTTVVDTPWPDPDGLRTTISLWGQDSDGGEALAFTVDVEMAMGTISAASGLDDLDVVGQTLRYGFGRWLAAALPEEAAARTLRWSMLEDLSGAFFVAGYALLREGTFAAPGFSDPERTAEAAARQADVCIGWATDSAMYVTLSTKGYNAVPIGPAAPVLDPLLAGLGHQDMRRRRTLDVTPRPDGGADVVSHFRDTYGAENHEMVLHEWLVDAVVSADGVITSLGADPRTLPWTECPGAAASASRVVGTAVADLPTLARRELVGPTTCTHLTSTLRGLADVYALTQPRGSGSGRSV
jgi:hypothetical protein